MENLINWFEIPATDFQRAKSFYQAILKIEIKQAEMFGTKMGFFPSDDKNVSGAIVHGSDYEPSSKGILVYLNGGKDLQQMLDRVVNVNGKIIVPKTQINPETGFFAVFLDSEGNRMAIHSKN